MLFSASDKNCSGCGSNPTNHYTHWTTSLIEFTISPLLGWTNTVWRGVVIPLKKFFYLDHAHLFLVRSAVIMKLGTFSHTSADETDTRARCLWQEAERRGIAMSKFCLRGRSGGDGPYLAQIKGKILKFNTLPRLTTPATLDWIDDKSAMRRKFSAAGFPIARGGIAFSYKKTLQLFRTIKGTVIIKPRTGSRSRHTTIAITTEKELYQAFQNAKQLSPWVIVEEQLRGWVFRVTLINRKVCAVMRREPPHVVGNGIKTIQELIDEENLLPARQGPVFHQIPITTETHAELERQNLTLESIPESGRVVTLHQKVGRSSGASTTDVTAQVHPENIQLFEKIAHFLDDSLVGIDMIIEDMSKPWYEQMPSGIIECNSLPFIDLHHFPLRGEVQNVAGALWDYVEQTI